MFMIVEINGHTLNDRMLLLRDDTDSCVINISAIFRCYPSDFHKLLTVQQENVFFPVFTALQKY